MQFLEVWCDQLQIIGGIRAHRVARNLGNLPGTKFREDALGERLALSLQPRDLLANINVRIVTDKS
jgi:hypothetical protein